MSRPTPGPVPPSRPPGAPSPGDRPLVTPEAAAARIERIPARLLPVLYLSWAHLCLVLACAGAALDPATVAGFFYQPRTLALVHLVTLGWITASILGALFIIGPMALRTPLPAGRLDYVAWGLVVAGTAGMAGHFFIDEYGGMIWGAGALVLGLLHVAGRVLRGLHFAPIEGAVKAHIALAFLNLFAAAALGILAALDKVRPFLPGPPLSRVFAHAHLAGLGWAAMMVFGAGYRLLPMLFPAAPPRGRTIWLSAVLLEIGVVGLTVGLLFGAPVVAASALFVAAAFAAFFAHVAWMRRRPRRPPAGRRRPDFALLHAACAMLSAAAAAGIGLWLALGPGAADAPGAAAAYGVFGLVGFLSQMVVGVGARLVPWFVVYHANRNMTACSPAPDPEAMADRRLQAVALAGWAAGVPLLAAGVWRESAPLVAAGASALGVAALLGAINASRILRRAFRPLA